MIYPQHSSDLNIAKRLIRDFYGSNTSERHKIPLIWHIKEGLYVLDQFQASGATKAAFCIHPIIQDDSSLRVNFSRILEARFKDQSIVALAMEYRNIANQGLRGKTPPKDIDIPLEEVRLMLIADKIQNKYSFEEYAKCVHPDSQELVLYFDSWLERLQVSKHYPMLYSDLSALRNRAGGFPCLRQENTPLDSTLCSSVL